MVSEPRPPDARTDDGARLGRAIRDRFRPNFVLAAGDRRHTRPGTLMRSTRTFGMRLALSQQNRHRIDATTMDTPTSTRPPTDYWPWPEADEQQEDFQTAARTRAAASAPPAAPKPQAQRAAEAQVDMLRQFVQRKATGAATPFGATVNASAAPVASAAPSTSSPAEAGVPAAHPSRVRRGLPITARRQGRTWAGPKTSPGGMARDAAPQPTSSIAHNRWGADAPEPLPDVVSSGIIDSAPIQRSSRPSSAPPAARQDQLRQLLERTGQIEPQTVSADDLVASLSARDAPRPAPNRSTPTALVADRATPRPGGTLARVVADAPVAPAGRAATAPASTPGASGNAPWARSRHADAADSSTVASRPVSADMLRRMAAPEATTDASGRAAASPVRTLSGGSATVVADGVAEAPMIGHRRGITTREPLDGGAHALPLVATSSSSIAVMERVQRVTADLDIDHEAVLPPRSFAGWDLEPAIDDAVPTPRGPLPLASARRQLRAHAPESRALAGDTESTVRRSVAEAPSTPMIAATPTAAGATTAAVTTRRADSTSRPAASTASVLTPVAAAGQAMAVTAAGLARSLRIDPAAPSALGLPIAAASPRRHRRTISRSLDGRGVQWIADDSTLDAEASDVSAHTGASNARSVTDRSTDSDSSTLRVQRTASASRAADGRDVDAHEAPTHEFGRAQPSTDEAGPDLVADLSFGGQDSGLSGKQLAALRQTGHDALLRRAMLATDRVAVATDDLAVAPPAMGHLGEDAAEAVPLSAPTPASAAVVPSSSREPSPITSDTIRRTMQHRLADEAARRSIRRRIDVDAATDTTTSIDLQRRPALAGRGDDARSNDAQRNDLGSADVRIDAQASSARPTHALASATSPIEAADRLVDVDTASVTSARPFVDRSADTVAEATSAAVAPLRTDRTEASTSSVSPPAIRANDSTTQTTHASTTNSSAASHRAAGPGSTDPAPSPTAPSAAASSADIRRAVAGMQPSDRWVPANPGTLFSSLTGRGVLQRRSLLTMSEASIAAAARLSFTAGPPSEAVLQRTLLGEELRRADRDPGSFDVADTARRSGPTDPTQTVSSDRPAARATPPAEPLIDRADRAIAPRSLQRSVDPLIDAPAPDAAPVEKGRTSRAKQPAQPLVDATDLAVAPRAVQRATDTVEPTDSTSTSTQGTRGRRPDDQDTPGSTRNARTDPTNGAARVAAVDLADRFLAELSRHRQERPKPLPIQFASIADLIVGKRTPLVSTSEASQRALAAVNKVAATTGDVIHLADPGKLSSPDAEMRGIIAHELTHVAAPSPAPRFFDDDRHTAEEHRATEIGELMRRSLAPPSGSGSVRGGSMSITQESTRSAARDSSGTIRREMDSSSRSSSSSPSSWSSTPSRDSSGTVRRALALDEMTTTTNSTTHGGDETTFSNSPAMKPEEFTAMLRDNFDLIVELLEDRIISDIERRGGRYRGDF